MREAPRKGARSIQAPVPGALLETRDSCGVRIVL
jgi:hypothetical protein